VATIRMVPPVSSSLPEFDLFVHPPMGRPFGVVVSDDVHAQAGHPCNTPAAFQKSLLSRQDGWLVEERSTEALRRIATLLNEGEPWPQLGARSAGNVLDRFHLANSARPSHSDPQASSLRVSINLCGEPNR